MNFFYRFLSVLFIMIVAFAEIAQATHIRAGEILARRLQGTENRYEIRLVAYTDTRSTVEIGAGVLEFGDGSPAIEGIDTDNLANFRTQLENDVAENIWIFEHTFPGPGTYTIRFREFNRNANVLNMANSVNTPFYIETTITIDPILGLNNTPILTVPPIDLAAVGARFTHNPGAYDPDGDSLSYSMVVPKQNLNLEVSNYRDPNAGEFGGTSEAGGATIFELDPITGELVWDAPGTAGQYNIAFIVEEWRKIDGEFVSIGYVTRDMQIIVQDTDNNRPELELPPDLCVEAGTNIIETIFASDPDGDSISLESYGGVYEQLSNPATFTFGPPQYMPSPAFGEFRWQTDGSHIREAPYAVHFRAIDDPPALRRPPLTDVQTWYITVVGPAPELNEVVLNEGGLGVNLDWELYEYQGGRQTVEVYRRNGSFEFEPEDCVTGIPEGSGYQLIGEVPVEETEFFDDLDGDRIPAGVTYCYRLVVRWPDTRGGESYASRELCVTGALDVPALTNVDIEVTDEANGEILVRWTPPYEIDQTLFPPPYFYALARANGAAGAAGLQTVMQPSQDTVFVDTGMNTRDQIYNYRVYLYDANQTLLDSSATASTVRLEPIPLQGAIILDWTALVPWSNTATQFPYHYIYRDNILPGEPEALVLIDSVNVLQTGFTYRDDGQLGEQTLSDELEYCYFVQTAGTYNIPQIPQSLLNKSQIVCAQPNDTIPPCAPIVAIDLQDIEDCRNFISNIPCGFNDFSNTLSWQKTGDGVCDEEVRSYNIYFSASGEEGTFAVIDNVSDTTYVHSGLSSFAGCYRISAIDRSGNESELSEPVCNDNCPRYLLPNLFTPNDDDVNETFIPFTDPERCPRFVESVEFTVYNRWGKEVFEYSSDGGENTIFINWDGRTTQGEELSSGVYYYVARVRFVRLRPEDSVEEIKGWVQVLR